MRDTKFRKTFHIAPIAIFYGTYEFNLILYAFKQEKNY